VGKLTTARELCRLIGARLLDNHTLLNVGSAVAEEGSPEFYALVRAVRSVTFDAILKMPPGVPFVFTNVVARGGTSGFLEENWQAVVELAQARRSQLFSVTLHCSRAENARRIAIADRAQLGKLQNPALLDRLAEERVLFDDGATFRTTIDNTELSAADTAARIQGWIQSIAKPDVVVSS
jgi:hypothetical protein